MQRLKEGSSIFYVWQKCSWFLNEEYALSTKLYWLEVCRSEKIIQKIGSVESLTNGQRHEDNPWRSTWVLLYVCIWWLATTTICCLSLLILHNILWSPCRYITSRLEEVRLWGYSGLRNQTGVPDKNNISSLSTSFCFLSLVLSPLSTSFCFLSLSLSSSLSLLSTSFCFLSL